VSQIEGEADGVPAMVVVVNVLEALSAIAPVVKLEVRAWAGAAILKAKLKAIPTDAVPAAKLGRYLTVI
jgi:hypothetical protein